MKKLYFATTNEGKKREVQAILGIPLEISPIHLDEVQSMDLAYVARKKAEEAFRLVKKPVIVDDVGVFIDAWKGLPGPFIKHFFDTLTYKGMFDQFKNEKNKKIRAVGIIAFHDGKKI